MNLLAMAYVSDAPRERAKLLAPCFLRGDSGTTESSPFALSSMLAPPTLARNVVVVPSAKQSASTSLSICSRLEGRSEPPTTPSIRAASSLCAITRGSPRSVRASHRPVADHRSRAAAASVCCRTASSISAARRAKRENSAAPNPSAAKILVNSRSRVRANRGSLFEGSNAKSCPCFVQKATRSALRSPSSGRARKTPSRIATSGMPARPAIPEPRNRRNRMVSAWSSA